MDQRDKFLGEVHYAAENFEGSVADNVALARFVSRAQLGMPGGVIIDNRRMLGDELAQAVVLFLLHFYRCEIFERVNRKFHRVERREVDMLKNRAGDTFYTEGARFARACVKENAQYRKNVPDCSVTSGMLGSGPLRDAHLARTVAQALMENHWPAVRIRDYLELYGYINLSGNVGRWNHDQYTRLGLGVEKAAQR
ncbi:hypothetical protein [Sphaerisporangium sp. NPDC051011]|uniref:hypothetical protein n=1 Tax=Sphaerisporangium sp. NPDC051011 TaxID=3155792 RepID=UPI0033E6D826